MTGSPQGLDPLGSPLEDPSAAFRRAMRLHAAGVCVVIVGTGDAINGMAATAVTSFSMEPPSVLVCVNRSASISEDLVEGRKFGVTVLAQDQKDIAAIFSRKPTGRARFAHSGWGLEPGELSWLLNAVANLSCITEAKVDYGSHRAVIGRVVGVMIGPRGNRSVDVIVCVLANEMFDSVTTAASDDETEEIKLEHNFRRILKAKCMHLGTPLQLVREKTILITKQAGDQQDPATKAWNFCTALYYKGIGLRKTVQIGGRIASRSHLAHVALKALAF